MEGSESRTMVTTSSWIICAKGTCKEITSKLILHVGHMEEWGKTFPWLSLFIFLCKKIIVRGIVLVIIIGLTMNKITGPKLGLGIYIGTKILFDTSIVSMKAHMGGGHKGVFQPKVALSLYFQLYSASTNYSIITCKSLIDDLLTIFEQTKLELRVSKWLWNYLNIKNNVIDLNSTTIKCIS